MRHSVKALLPDQNRPSAYCLGTNSSTTIQYRIYASWTGSDPCMEVLIDVNPIQLDNHTRDVMDNQ